MSSETVSRIAPRKRIPSGRVPGWMKVATLHVSTAEKAAAAPITIRIEPVQVMISRIRISRW